MNPRFRIPADILRSLFTAHPWAALALLGVLMGCSSPRDGALEEFSRWHDNARAQAQAGAAVDGECSGSTTLAFVVRQGPGFYERKRPMLQALLQLAREHQLVVGASISNSHWKGRDFTSATNHNNFYDYFNWDGDAPRPDWGPQTKRNDELTRQSASYITGQSIAVDGGWIKGLL